jgi:hypothetical protein
MPNITHYNSRLSYLINNADTYSVPVLIHAGNSIFILIFLSKNPLAISFFSQPNADKSENEYSTSAAKNFKKIFVTLYSEHQ